MKPEINYCDDCGEPLKKGQGFVIKELPDGVASANEGESAILCKKCMDENGWGICYVCKEVAVLGSSETGVCEKPRCKKVFHTACDEGYHTDPLNFFCSCHLTS